MTQFINTLLTSSLANASNAATPAGYTRTPGSSNPGIISSQFIVTFSGSNFCLWYDNNQMQGDIVIATVKLGSAVANASKDAGVTITDSSGAGYYVAARDTTNDLRIFALATGGALSGSALYTVSSTWADNDNISLSYSTSTGVIKILKNGVQIGVDFSGVANNTYRYGGMRTHAGKLRELTVEYTLAHAILSINGGTPLTAGQTGISVTASGFSGVPTAGTATWNSGTKSIAVSNISGSSSAFTFEISDRVEGADYPSQTDTVTLTFTKGAESASITTTITKKLTEATVSFVSPEILNNKFLGYWITAAGHTADAADLFYTIPPEMPDLVVNSSSACITTNAGVFTCQLRPTLGGTAGKTYLFEVTVNEAGVVGAEEGLTTKSLTGGYLIGQFLVGSTL